MQQRQRLAGAWRRRKEDGGEGESVGVRVEADTSSPLSPYTRRPSSCAQLGRTARHGHWTPSPHLAFPWGRAPPPAPGLINKQLNNCRIAMLSHVKQLSMQYTPTHYSTAPRPVPIRTCIRPFSMRTIQAASGRNLLPCIQSSRTRTLHLQIAIHAFVWS